MLRSLALIVATELGAFGLGLSTGGRSSEWNEALESLRGRWFFVLVAFLAAAGFTLAWDFFEGFGASAMTQALGLALLAGLPLYACGRLLRGINAVRTMTGLTGDGAVAALGAAALAGDRCVAPRAGLGDGSFRCLGSALGSGGCCLRCGDDAVPP